MTVTRETFVTAFPEFGNAVTYPDDQINFWIDQAGFALDSGRFGKQLDFATMLFVAHNITLGVNPVRAETAGPGGAASVTLAPVSSKAVDGVSKSYDTGLTAFAGAGPWNATSYGQRLYQLLRATNTGPIYRVSPRCVGIRGGRAIGWR